MGAPLVSVLVPVRDEARYLEEALASLARQTLEDLEVLVVDDGSTDGSAEVAAQFAAGDARFRLFRQGPRGVVAAAERARAEARGRYVACMDGDDRSRPRRLELQLAALEDEGLAACGCGVTYFGETAVSDGLRRYERWLNSLTTTEAAARDVFVESPLANPALFVRREVLDGVGGYRETPWPEDYDLVLRLWAAGARFRNVAEVLLEWRDHPDRLSRTSGRFTQEAFARCKAHHLRATLLAERDAVVWGAGPVGKLYARALVRAGVRVVAFVDVDPRKLGKRVYGLPVLPHEGGPGAAEAVAVGAVAGSAARERLRALAREQGRVEGVDFVAVA